MYMLRTALSLSLLLAVAGCSGDMAKRTAYETLQNVHQQECLKGAADNCDKRESYDDYLRKRKALESSE
ncbi:MAG: hypothetical protein WA632_10565 [Gallionella sp.]